MKRSILVIACLLVMSLGALTQNRARAFSINERLGRGINMGNSFEAPTETAWGNPWQPRYFDIIANLGFDHVRVPVRWEPPDRSMAEPPYTIYGSFLNRIKEVVDKALANGLLVIINMHHHEAFLRDPVGQRTRFLTQWQQIAHFFKDYPDELLFEVFNEPHGNIDPAMWNNLFAEALSVIRVTNPTRVVLLGTAEWGGLRGVQYLNLPPDENLILTVHYYNPFEFTHQGASWVGNQSEAWLGTRWHDTSAERESIINEFAGTIAFSKNHNIPVHVGEFGAYGRADMASRVRYTNFLARWFEQQQFSWAYWEFSAGFGIFSPTTGTFNMGLVNALLHNPMPEPVAVSYTPVFSSNFEAGNTGWNFWASGGALGTISNDGRSLVATVTNPGSETWHAQLVIGNIPLVANHTYRITVTGHSPNSRGAILYLGRSVSPWDAYSGFYNVSFGTNETTSVFTFTMNNAGDPNARLVFDLGTATGSIALREVKVELVSFSSLPLQPPGDYNIVLYPNPVGERFFVSGGNNYDIITIYDLSGRKIYTQKGSATGIPTSNLRPGGYLVNLTRDNKELFFKIIR